jgi:type IV secretion system protein VirB1
LNLVKILRLAHVFFSENYVLAKENAYTEDALLAALSAYNTGNFLDGFSNGYVQKYNFCANQTVTPSFVGAKKFVLKKYATETLVYFNKKTEGAKAVNKKNEEKVVPVVSLSPEDADIPGVIVEYTPEEAEKEGAFEETALSFQDAWEANIATTDDPDSTAIMVAGKKVK